MSGGEHEGDREVIARETFEITIEIREGDVSEFWAKTDAYPHFVGALTGIEAIRRSLQNDPRVSIDGRGVLALDG